MGSRLHGSDDCNRDSKYGASFTGMTEKIASSRRYTGGLQRSASAGMGELSPRLAYVLGGSLHALDPLLQGAPLQ